MNMLFWVFMQSYQSLRCPLEKNFSTLAIQNEPSEDSDQIVRMRRLILIFARRTFP